MRALFFLALAVLVVVMLLPRLAAWSRAQFGNRPRAARRTGEGPRLPDVRRHVARAPVRGGRHDRPLLQPGVPGQVPPRGATRVRPVWSGASAPTLALEEDLAAAAAAGFEAVELSLPKLWPDLERRGPEVLAESLTRRRLAAMALGPVTDVTFRDAAGHRKGRGRGARRGDPRTARRRRVGLGRAGRAARRRRRARRAPRGQGDARSALPRERAL